MTNKFDQIIPRNGTSSLKYDMRQSKFGKSDVLPLWVADMDFAAPQAVQTALAHRVAHPIYGYTLAQESIYVSLQSWLSQRHHLEVPRASIMLCPGVVPSLHACILALTEQSEGVIVQPPVYAPFLSAPDVTGRRLLLNPLKIMEGTYRFNLDGLAQCATQGGRLLLLCSPHNPIGRVWAVDELQALLAVCEEYNIAVVSDEIHADLVYPGCKHVPLAALNDKVKIVTAVAPSKTFNIPGLGLSALVIPDASQREAIARAFELLHVNANNPFSLAAFEAAYREGEGWLDELIHYLTGTRNLVRDFLQRHVPQITMVEPEGTYLLWLDCRGLGMDDMALQHFFVYEAGVGLSPGTLFGMEGSGFMRMNIGAPRSIIKQALDKIARAVMSRI